MAQHLVVTNKQERGSETGELTSIDLRGGVLSRGPVYNWPPLFPLSSKGTLFVGASHTGGPSIPAPCPALRGRGPVFAKAQKIFDKNSLRSSQKSTRYREEDEERGSSTPQRSKNEEKEAEDVLVPAVQRASQAMAAVADSKRKR